MFSKISGGLGKLLLIATTEQLGAPATQVPDWQVSPLVHELPSSQADPFAFVGFEHRPVAGLHVPALWHWSDAAHATADPVHVPDWHASACVHGFPSLHVVPLALAGFEQEPVAGSQVPGS